MSVSAKKSDPGLVEGHIAVARDVVRTEIAGLDALSASIGPAFGEAVEMLNTASGRVIVSGIGKSGHVGTKIAATLASTGKPAQFVHAAEASHGDLGMITPEDAVLALSKSGETSELRDLVAFTRRFSIPLIAMTADETSALGRQADILLLVPDADEACPNGLAPTTSTTMMMVLGDALAVALLKKRNFSAHDFKRFHPGGKLGAQLMPISALTHGADAVPLAHMDTLMSEVLVTMSAKRFGCVGIQDDDGRLVGIITDGDLRRHMGADLMDRTAGSIMTHGPKTVAPDMLTAEAVSLMNASKITTLFVVENGKPTGIVHLHDLLRVGAA